MFLKFPMMFVFSCALVNSKNMTVEAMDILTCIQCLYFWILQWFKLSSWLVCLQGGGSWPLEWIGLIWIIGKLRKHEHWSHACSSMASMFIFLNVTMVQGGWIWPLKWIGLMWTIGNFKKYEHWNHGCSNMASMCIFLNVPMVRSFVYTRALEN